MRITRSATMNKKKKKKQRRSLGYEDILEEMMLYEILPRLPVKAILRFRSVCRRWREVITNDFLFIANQAQHSIHYSSNQPAFMYHNRDDSLSVISFEEQDRYRLPPPFFSKLLSRLHYVGSCNGLVHGFTSCHKKAFVCNPIAHRITFVPNFHKGRFLKPYSNALAFDPPLTPYAGPEFMSFKLICPIENLDKMTFKAYNYADKEWHDSKAYVELPLQYPKWSTWRLPLSKANVFVEGKVYWIIQIFLLWFDVEEEVAGTIPLPTNSGATVASIGVCGGELSYCNIMKNSELNVWLRRKGWVKLHEVRLDTIIKDNWDVIAPGLIKLRNCGTAFLRRQKLCTMSYEGGDVLMFLIRMAGGTRVFGFNSKTKELKELSAPGLLQSYFPAWPYKAILLRNRNGDVKRSLIS